MEKDLIINEDLEDLEAMKNQIAELQKKNEELQKEKEALKVQSKTEEKEEKKSVAKLHLEKNKAEKELEEIKNQKLAEKEAYKRFIKAHEDLENSEEMINDIFDMTSDDPVATRKAYLTGILWLDSLKNADDDFDEKLEFDKIFNRSEDWILDKLEARNKKEEQKRTIIKKEPSKSLWRDAVAEFFDKKKKG